ncbi:MAG: type II toxin-antitoxin system Phd/YefM family antitoxin [Anaerolineales bacterium]|nr:type II toxin-antitoxin system Phd/YefM family antitoxin [Anaerolineales bacterium]
MRTLQVSKFKTHCLGLLKEIRDTGEPLLLTLRGETLAIIQPPSAADPQQGETVAETLERLHPLLLSADEEFEAPLRNLPRPSATHPFPDQA